MWNADCSRMYLLMAAESRPAIEPPHNPKGCVKLAALYKWCEFCDDISGVQLDHAMATAARRKEIEFFKARGVYTKVKQEPWMKIISTKWLDQNKGDAAAPNYRSRLV